MAIALETERPQGLFLRRHAGNPILEPRADHWWESRYVLNAGACRVNGTIYIFYRAVGLDGVSRIGLAKSRDGITIEERSPVPVFEPEGPAESMGCEDPRLVVMDGTVYLFFNAYDGQLAQIGLASMSLKDFEDECWDRWNRLGYIFPGQPHRNPILFPETLKGKYVLYYRVKPDMLVASSDHLGAPWRSTDDRFLAGPREGFWDEAFIGGGAPPIKTSYGWLLVYHGVDRRLFYRLGVLMVDLEDPSRILYRSPEPVLEPREACEVGRPGKCWVPNVVFSCGAVPREDKEILGADDEILVYYGASDSVIGVATAAVSDLVPRDRLEPIANPGTKRFEGSGRGG